jgi:hypothetical protein
MEWAPSRPEPAEALSLHSAKTGNAEKTGKKKSTFPYPIEMIEEIGTVFFCWKPLFAKDFRRLNLNARPDHGMFV